MLGDSDSGDGQTGTDSLGETRGLIQRVFEHLFMRIREKQEQAREGEVCKFMLRCSFLEIYNETLTDLLNPAATNLAVREDIRKGVFVEGLREDECCSVEDVIQLLQQGISNRRVGETNMNDKSSRSHCVFTCTLESKTTSASGATNIRFSRLHLVDLAGSERQKSSGAQGERLREASSINKSLSTLGHVIASLVDLQSGKARHVPYRDSRLTFLLQDSLGGNAKACLIATISPATVNLAETLSTLRFADATKRIKNKAVVNEDTTGEAAALQRELKRVREELARYKNGSLLPAQQQQQAGLGTDLPWAEGFGSPLRFSTLRTISGSPLMASPGAGTQQGTRRALVAALRREETAAREAARLQAELQQLGELLKLKDGDLQRQTMIAKLKDARLARLQNGNDAADERVVELQQEVELLKARLEAHPEVKRFAAENLRLGQEVDRLRELIDREELQRLQSDVGGLRGELLAVADALEAAQEDAVAQQAMAASLRMESDMAADHIRSQAVADKDIEVSQLALQLTDEQEQLRTANAARVQLQQQLSCLQQNMQNLERTNAALQAELSPARRKASRFEQQLELVREESSAALLRASSELTLRSQVELEAQQLEQRMQRIEAECAQLRLENQQLEHAKTEGERQRAAQLASLAAEHSSLQTQMEQERAVAAERQGDYNDALHQLDGMRKRVSTLEQECSSLQRELHETRETLASQRDEHEAAQSAAAESIAAALKGAQEMQDILKSKEAQVAELQQELDSLRQLHRQLEQHKKHVEFQLAQRDNELQDLGQTVEELEVATAKHKEELEHAAAEAASLRSQCASHQRAGVEAAGRIVALTAQLEATAAQLPELESQVLLARAEATDLRRELAAEQEALVAAQAQLTVKDEELGSLRGQVAAEVAAAALTVQQLLAAQQGVASLQTQLVAAQQAAQDGTAFLAQQQQAAQHEREGLRQQLADAEAPVALHESQRSQQLAAEEAAQAGVAALQGRLMAAEAALAQLQAEHMHALHHSQEASHQQLAELRAQAEVQQQQLRQEVAAREEQLQQLQAALEEAESVVAAGAGTADQSEVQAQLAELVNERESWIEEMHQQRRAARAASDAAVALERRLTEVTEAQQRLEAELTTARQRESKLEEELTGLTGQHNTQQRIQYHKKVKDENNALKEELSKLRIDLNIVSVRYERAKGELARFRTAAGQAPLPDYDAEEQLRESLAVVQSEKIKLERDYEDLASSVLHAVKDGNTSMPPSPCGEDTDIVIEFADPVPAQLGAAARQALQDIRTKHRDTQHRILDLEHQVRMLKESSKLQRIRRTSHLQTSCDQLVTPTTE
ncbi:hypothetical protein N2152v2_002531 [Parachlorella kessleri]